ncbi:hypothetical protein RMSM_06780 [Rhodopirellula maiorica SM1]|uniref:Uncharacterized protein n=2 Tax=Novipirellula TaxID=2795426 RepID=M5RB86_9BACT|nr:hypothetical protein RMSM_06780 [Rhodopirellula maiorica SM1]
MFAAICLILLPVTGCGSGENAIQARLKEVAYTPEKLVAELAVRLKTMDGGGGGRVNEASRSGGETPNEDGRGGGPGAQASPGDGPGGNPFTLEAIAADIKTKINSMQEAAGEQEDVMAKVVAEIEKSDIKDDLKQKVIAAIR